MAARMLERLRRRGDEARAAREARGQRPRHRAERRRGKRSAWGKRMLMVLAGLLFALLALMVGDSDYRATLLGWTPLLAYLVALLLARGYLAVLAASLSFWEESELAECRRGEEVAFQVGFRNAGPGFFFRIRTFFYISDLDGKLASLEESSLALGPFEEASVSFKARFEHIGAYTAGLDRVVVSDFFGLFSRELPNPVRHELRVTPRLQVLDNASFSEDALVESASAAKSVLADSMDYSHVRDYVAGDPLKTVHWKLSARNPQSSYYTRLFEVYTNPGVGIVMDFYGPNPQPQVLMSMFDAVVESALSIGRFAVQRGLETELLFCNRDGVRRCVPIPGDEGIPRLMAEVPNMSSDPAAARPAHGILADQVESQHGQNNLVLCSANLDTELVNVMLDAKVRRRSPFFVAVVPPGLSGRALDKYCAPLSRLDEADIPYVVIRRSEELVKIGVR
ncbi:MAG: DUF58 domain-containing protein [Coriobacteriales bacterium]